jgi:hypothetical protein
MFNLFKRKQGKVATDPTKVSPAHGIERTLHRRAVRELLNGNAKPLEKLAKRTAMFNCGNTLRRKLKRKIENSI